MSREQSDETNPIDFRFEFFSDRTTLTDAVRTVSSNQYSMTRIQLLKAYWLHSTLPFFGILGVFQLGSIVFAKPITQTEQIGMLILGAVTSILYTLYITNPVSYQARYRKYLQTTIRATTGLFVGPTLISICNEGIEYTDRWGFALYPWESTWKVDQHAEWIAITIANQRVIIMPTSVLSEESIAFMQERFGTLGGPGNVSRSLLAEGPSPCPRCRYELMQNPSATCPECGHTLTLSELSAVRLDQQDPEPATSSVG